MIKNGLNNRVLFIDYIKAVTMILVIMGHVNYANQGIKAWIYSFHMPVFFFVSGLLLKNDIKKWIEIKTIIQSKFSRLMIPFFLWSLIFAKLTIPNVVKIFYGSYWSISSSGSLTSLWFLPAMFVALLLYYFTVWKVRVFSTMWGKLLILFFSLIIGCFLPRVKFGYPWCANVAFIAFSFLLLGVIFKPYIFNAYNIFRQNNRKSVLRCFAFTTIMLGITLLYKYNHPESGYVLMGNARYGCFPLFVLPAFCGILMLVSFSMLLELLRVKGNGLLSFVGQNTLCIFAVQKPIIRCFRIMFQHVHCGDTVVLLSTTFGTLLLSCIFCVVINKYVPVLTGKKA